MDACKPLKIYIVIVILHICLINHHHYYEDYEELFRIYDVFPQETRIKLFV